MLITRGDGTDIAYGDVTKDADVIIGLFEDEGHLDRRMTLRVLETT